MEQIVAKLLIYGDLPENSILIQLSEVYKDFHNKNYSNADLITRCYKQVKRLLVLGTSCAFDKNLWHNYLTYLLIMDENPFSLTCEKVGSKDIIPAGTSIKIKLTGKSNYENVIESVYRIGAKKVSSLKFSIPKQHFTGDRILPGKDVIKGPAAD